MADKYKIIDKNGNTRAYAKSKDAAEVKVEQLEKEKHPFAPFEVCANKEEKAAAAE